MDEARNVHGEIRNESNALIEPNEKHRTSDDIRMNFRRRRCDGLELRKMATF
jgi:hypothetical protein